MGDGKRRVLLVDDEPSLIKTVGKRLEIAGYELLVAVDGEEALSTAQAERPDLIVLDLMLPKMNGLQACAALKQDDRYKQIPIILFSARADEMGANEARRREAGADAYIDKGAGSAVLLEQIKTLLQ